MEKDHCIYYENPATKKNDVVYASKPTAESFKNTYANSKYGSLIEVPGVGLMQRSMIKGIAKRTVKATKNNFEKQAEAWKKEFHELYPKRDTQPTQRQYKALVNYFLNYVCRGKNLWGAGMTQKLIMNLWKIYKEKEALEYLEHLERNNPLLIHEV